MMGRQNKIGGKDDNQQKRKRSTKHLMDKKADAVPETGLFNEQLPVFPNGTQTTGYDPRPSFDLATNGLGRWWYKCTGRINAQETKSAVDHRQGNIDIIVDIFRKCGIKGFSQSK